MYSGQTFLYLPSPPPRPAMTAREFSALFKPYLPVRRVAEAAGFLQNTWYTTVSRDRELTADELDRLRKAAEAHADEIRELASALG